MGVTATLELLVGNMCGGLGEGKERCTEISLIDGFCFLYLIYLRDIFLDLECSRPGQPSQEAPGPMHDLGVPLGGS